MRSGIKISKHLRLASLATFEQSGEKAIRITFPYNTEDLARIRSLEGRRFHDDKSKYWSTPLIPTNIEKLREWGFSIDPKLIQFIKESSIENIKEIQIPGLKGQLRPFQNKGVATIEQKNGRVLLADDMGLGKTIQAIAWLQLHQEIQTTVIVCPASVKSYWRRMIRLWMDPFPTVRILFGTKPDSSIKSEVVIINYDILANKTEKYTDQNGKKKQREIPRSGWVDYLIDMKPELVIFDESQYIKNTSARRTYAARKLSRHSKYILGLSGTPIENRPIEIYNICKIIDDSRIPSFWPFVQKYCAARHNGFGWDYSGASNTQELNELLTSTIMIRRKKSEVLRELPDKVYSYVPFSLENQKEYNEAERNFVAYVRKNLGAERAKKISNAEALTKIEGLKQLTIRGKIDQCIEWIENFLDTREKLVVFTTHQFTVDTLMQQFRNVSVKIDGSVRSSIRQKIVDDFQQSNSIQLFVGNIKAAGVGITLTAASNVAFLELPYKPSEISQAEDRLHRIGQEESVTVYFLLAEDTIEERIVEMLDNKRKIIDRVLDGQETDQDSLLTELIDLYYET